MEKILICYSSQTGNTKKVAEAVKTKCENADLLAISEVKSVEEYDLIIVGGWIDKGTYNEEATNFVKTIKNKKVAFFFTIGVFPTAKHGHDSVTKIKGMFAEGNNEVINHFHCQGAIAPYIVNMFLEKMKEHPTFEETKLRYEYAAKHPNEEDFFAAKYFMKRTLEVFKTGTVDPHYRRQNEKDNN